jgi:hypothetical protein
LYYSVNPSMQSDESTIGFGNDWRICPGLRGESADCDDLYRRVAVYVDKILKGTKPADLPVQQAIRFEFVIQPAGFISA